MYCIFVYLLLFNLYMKRIRGSNNENQQLSEVLNDGLFKRRNVEVGEPYALEFNYVLFDVFPNICARCIEIEGNFATVSRLAVICKDGYEVVKKFVSYICAYVYEKPLLVKNDAIYILATLAVNQAIRDKSDINNLVKNIMVVLLDPEVHQVTRGNALIIAANTIDLIDGIYLDPNYIVRLLSSMMDSLQLFHSTDLTSHGYIFTLLNKLYDKGLITSADLDLDFLKEYSYLEIVKAETVPDLCRDHTALVYCKLVKEGLINIEYDYEDISREVIEKEMPHYPATCMSIDVLLLLEELIYAIEDPELLGLSDIQLEFLKKCSQSNVLSTQSLIQSLEDSSATIDTFCHLNIKTNSLRYIHRVMLEEYIRKNIFPIIKEIKSASKCVKGQVLNLTALMGTLAEELSCQEICNSTMCELMIVGLEMFNDSESSLHLKESILYIILSYIEENFLTYPDVYVSKLFYEQVERLQQMARSVINLNEDPSSKFYSYAKQIVDSFSKYNILVLSSQSSDDLS